MNLIDSSEVWDVETDTYSHLAVLLYRPTDDTYHYAHVTAGRQHEFDLNTHLKDLTTTLIPSSHIWPAIEPGLTAAPTPPPQNSYIKTPQLIDYEHCAPDFLPKDLLLKEARTCEILKANPHPNIVEYHGCIVKDGRIRGLCLTKYAQDLDQRVRDGGVDGLDVEALLNELRSGIEHLHGLGLVHNDINPRNVMFADDGTPVIIDFDSCEKEGSVPACKAGTFGWDEGTSDVASRENDLLSLRKIEEWLRKGTRSDGE